MDYGSKDYRDTNGYARGIDKGMDVRISYLGISGAAVEKIYSIGDAFIAAAKGKIGLFGYYLGIFLAFTGMLTEAVTETLSGSLLHWAELVTVFVSVAGLGYSLWLLKKDFSTEAHEKASPLITMIELGIGTCGVVNSVAKFVSTG